MAQTSDKVAEFDSRSQQNNFDFLRFFFSLAVVFSHSFALGEGNEDNEPICYFFNKQSTSGGLAVYGFFIISGFLVTQSWERSRSAFDFFRKRISRIYPGFIVANAIGTYVIVWFAVEGGKPSLLSIKDFSIDCLWLQGSPIENTFVANVYPRALNGSLWTIPYEFWCYVGVALLGISTLLANRWFILGIFVVSLATSYLFPAFNLTWIGGGIIGYFVGYPFFWARLLPFYLVGIVAFRFQNHLIHSNLLAILAIALLVISSFVPLLWTVALPVLFGYLVFWFAYYPSIRFHHFGRFGDFSYGLYLYAFPIQQLVVMYMGNFVNGKLSMPPLKLFVISAPLSIAAGVLSWFMVEKWFLSRRKVSLLVSSDTQNKNLSPNTSC